MADRRSKLRKVPDRVLGPQEHLTERPFTDPRHTVREVGVMGRMLAQERERARSWAASDAASSEGHVVRERDAHGRRHLLVVPSERALLEARDLTAVGFFARPRAGVDHGILFELEEELVGRMRGYGEAGLLSYYDVELVKGAYGNLILFSTPDVPPEWHADAIHRRAVELSPGHYHEVRLHKGSVAGCLLDEGEIVIERTKYFDFDGPERWQALRQWPPPA